MWNTRLRVVKAGRIPDPYKPGQPGRLTLNPDQGATIDRTEHFVECQPVSLIEEDQGGTRVHVATSWRIITRPGQHLTGLTAADGVLVDGIDGVLSVEGEIAHFVHPRLGHDELTVTRWKG